MTVQPKDALDKNLPPVEMQSDTGTVDVREILSLVTKDWVNAALTVKYSGVVVETMDVVRMGAGNSIKIWINLTYNDVGQRAGLPFSMIVKAGFDRHDPVMLFTYAAEMMTYRDVLPRFPINSPICYYAGAGPKNIAAAILMEDLCQRDIRFCHATKSLTKAEAAAFLDGIARTHARSWEHPSLTDGSWDWPKANEEILASLSDYFAMLTSPKQWAHFVTLPRCQAVSKIFHDRERFMAAFGELNARNAKLPNIVMVGDTHLSNLYIEGDGTPGFLDFLARIGPWVDEVTYFMGAALDIADRRAWEQDLLRHYLDRLTAYGVKAPSFESAWDAYRDTLLFGLFTWMTNGEHFQIESVNTANAARLGIAAVDHDTLGRLLGK